MKCCYWKMEKQFNFSALSVSCYILKVCCNFCSKTLFSQITEWPGSPAVNLAIPHVSVCVGMFSVRLYGVHAVPWWKQMSLFFFSSIFIHFCSECIQTSSAIFLLGSIRIETDVVIYCRTRFVRSDVLNAELFWKVQRTSGCRRVMFFKEITAWFVTTDCTYAQRFSINTMFSVIPLTVKIISLCFVRTPSSKAVEHTVNHFLAFVPSSLAKQNNILFVHPSATSQIELLR